MRCDAVTVVVVVQFERRGIAQSDTEKVFDDRGRRKSEDQQMHQEIDERKEQQLMMKLT
jgi:hypothetical protein